MMIKQKLFEKHNITEDSVKNSHTIGTLSSVQGECKAKGVFIRAEKVYPASPVDGNTS